MNPYWSKAALLYLSVQRHSGFQSCNDEFETGSVAHADGSTVELSPSHCLAVILFQPHNHFVCFKYAQDN